MDFINDVTIHPKIKTALKELKKLGVIGLSRMKELQVRIVPESQGRSFIVEVPYADSILHWEVIFSNEDINFAPDFEFINDQFLADPDINVIDEHLPSLSGWNIDDPKCLYRVLVEILQLYSRHQIDRLHCSKFTRQLSDYLTLTTELRIPDKDIEVYVDSNDFISFLIALPIDSTISIYQATCIADYFDSGNVSNPGSEMITIKIAYTAAMKLQPIVWLSPSLEDSLRRPKNMHFPSLNRDGQLKDYITQVKRVINERLNTIRINFNRRQEFVCVMLAIQPSSILEYDNVLFSEMTMMLEAEEHRCLTNIRLGIDFDKPVVQLRPLNYTKGSKIENLAYSFNANASAEDTVKKILYAVHAFLLECKQNEMKKIRHDDRLDKSYATMLKKQQQ